MKRIKLTIFYDGTSFHGWQTQRTDRTVQGVLEETLSAVFKQEINVVASGRTDSGVHARAQVVHFDFSSCIPIDRLAIAVNSRLPQDIRVLHAVEVSKTFHARFDAKLRVYEYTISDTLSSDPIDERYTLRYHRVLNLGKLNALARVLIGEHDFTTFCAAGDSSPHKIRHISSAVFFRRQGYLVFRIAGTAFLWRMVRSLVGSMLYVYGTDNAEQGFKTMLEAKDRDLAGPTAAAKGLFLHKVLYHEKYSI